MDTFVINFDIGGVRHSDKVRSANASTACKKAAQKIKNSIIKLECIKCTAEVERLEGTGDTSTMIAKFPDVKALLK